MPGFKEVFHVFATMVKLKTFEIILSASDGFFMAGEILQGYVTVDLKYPMKMQGKFIILINLFGMFWGLV